MLLNYLPPEINSLILSELSFEDLLNLKEACQSTTSIICHTVSKFYRLQIADDPFDCLLESIDGKKVTYNIENVKIVLDYCPNINSIIIAARGVDKETSGNEKFSNIFHDGLYNENGYLGTFFDIAPYHYLHSNQLKTVALHVDLMIDKMFESRIIYPTNDLKYASNVLFDKNFDVFIQIGFCAVSKHPYDVLPRTFIGMNMYDTFVYFKDRDYNCSIDITSQTEYMDLTLEKKNLEYSFALFYYDENLCLISDDNDDSMDEIKYNEIIEEEEYFDNNSYEINSSDHLYYLSRDTLQLPPLPPNNVNNSLLLQKMPVSDDNLLMPLEIFQNPLLSTGQDTIE
ncbi:F-box domain-containing protein [Strongyloides ratti]|uniref:F-box domain-containing protein n=1 Tax=Strongyloides ratti TaxID=34506 RepID=A0A090L1D2_STRRB|nr:F-box domain-containing protein [Strongyloides ratti]CEF63511.1 F-box domain-containing protein [Strongyloides ratti]